jgi:hypothetical protein
MVSANRGIRFSVNLWAGIVGDIVVGCYLTCRLLPWSSGNCSTRAAWRCASSRETEAYQQQRRSSALWGRCPGVAERDISRKVNWTSRAVCMASSAAESNSDGFCFRGNTGRITLTQSLPGLLKISWQDFKHLWQWSMPAYVGVWERMPCGTQQCALEWMETASNTCCNYEIVWSFDSLRH